MPLPGNIDGWNPYNANAAFLTGVVFPGFRDPYVYGSHFGIERQLPGNSVLKVSWVGTFGHKLYRSEDINRVFGGLCLVPDRDRRNQRRMRRCWCRLPRQLPLRAYPHVGKLRQLQLQRFASGV